MPRRKISFQDSLLNIGFIGIHLGCLLVIPGGFSWFAVAVCLALYAVRMFSITAFYHRYFSHRTYKTSRPFQFVMGVAGASCLQNGPLWWSAHHRHHHRHSDTEEDVHSPIAKNFYWAHVGWILSKKYNFYRDEDVKDLVKYPELVWLQKFHMVPAIMIAVGLWFLGEYLAGASPELGTNGLQLVAWGFFVSTTILYHACFTINSLMHLVGRRRFDTDDQSRNSLILALITFGEGWHNNHHRYHASERQGFYWWEIDLSHYGLKVLSWLGLVWDLKAPPAWIYEEAEGKRDRRATPGRRRRSGMEREEKPTAPLGKRESDPAHVTTDEVEEEETVTL